MLVQTGNSPEFQVPPLSPSLIIPPAAPSSSRPIGSLLTRYPFRSGVNHY